MKDSYTTTPQQQVCFNKNVICISPDRVYNLEKLWLALAEASRSLVKYHRDHLSEGTCN